MTTVYKVISTLSLVLLLQLQLQAQRTMSSADSSTTISARTSKHYLSLYFNTGLASFRNIAANPKVQFDYTYQNSSTTYQYSDSLSWKSTKAHPILFGFGLEYGSPKGFYSAFEFNFFSKAGTSTLEQFTIGYNKQLQKKLSIRPSLSFIHAETFQRFSNTIDTDHKNAVMLGQVFHYQHHINWFEWQFLGDNSNTSKSTKVGMREVSLGLMPRIECSYPLSNVFSIRVGVAYWFRVSDKLNLSLQSPEKNKDIKLNASGLQFSDNNVAPRYVFNCQGLLCNVTCSIKLSAIQLKPTK